MKLSPFKAIYPNLDYVASSDAFFGTVKYDYPEYKKNGFFQQSPNKGFYIYRIEQNNKSFTGIIANASIEDLIEGRIKKHEHTIALKEQQQIRLLISRGAIVKPVLLMYPEVNEIKEFILEHVANNEIFYSTYFEEEGSKHSIWKVSNTEKIEKLRQLFMQKVPCTYIADGHHRSSTSLMMYKRAQKNEISGYDQLLAVLFSVAQLDVHAYNRIIRGFNGLSLSAIMVKFSKLFDIEILTEALHPSRKFELLMLINNEYYKLNWKKEVLEAQNQEEVVLDASLLEELVLKDIFGIQNSRTDDRITYVECVKGLDYLQKKIKGNKQQIAFALYPVELTDLMEVSDQNKIMPPKSTWFEPRIKNGLIVMEFLD